MFSLGAVAYEMLVGQTPDGWPAPEDSRLGRLTDAPAAHRARLDAMPGRVEQALARKAHQGVRVCLLLDALGSVKVDRRFLAPLLQAGGRAAYFMPMLRLPLRGRANLRNHRKMVIVDGRAAIVGGMNMAVEYMGPEARPDRWQDISVRLTGPAAGQAFEIFRSDWQFAAREDLGSEKPYGGRTDGTATMTRKRSSCASGSG